MFLSDHCTSWLKQSSQGVVLISWDRICLYLWICILYKCVSMHTYILHYLFMIWLVKCIYYFSVGEPVPFFTGSRLRLPLKKACISDPWSRFYKFLLTAPTLRKAPQHCIIHNIHSEPNKTTSSLIFYARLRLI